MWRGVRCFGRVVSGVEGFGDGGVWSGFGGGVVLGGIIGIWVLVSGGVIIGEVCCVFLVELPVYK